MVSLTVNPLSVGGTVDTSTLVCGGVNSGTLKLTGHTGNVVRWESSTDGGGIWVPIFNTTTSLIILTLLLKQWYRAVVKVVCVQRIIRL